MGLCITFHRIAPKRCGYGIYFSWQIISFWLELFIGTTDFTIPWKWKDSLLNMLLAQVPYFTISLRSLEIISSLITDQDNTFYIWSGIPGRHKLKSKNLPRFARERLLMQKSKAIVIYSRCSEPTGKNDDVINLSSLDLSSKLTPLFATNVFKTDDW